MRMDRNTLHTAPLPVNYCKGNFSLDRKVCTEVDIFLLSGWYKIKVSEIRISDILSIYILFYQKF